MIVGFTGTRNGMTPHQLVQLRDELRMRLSYEGTPVFHHGAAIGADRQAAEIAAEMGYTVVAHPAGPNPLDRNRDIVAACDVLIATPKGVIEQRRGSGTWATMRYGQKARKPVVVIWPNAEYNPAVPAPVITEANVRDWFPAPRTENPLVGDPWWQLQGIGLFMAIQIIRLVPAGPEQQQALVELRRCLDTGLLALPAPNQEEVERTFARTLAPWCPSPPEVIAGMLDLAELWPEDVVYDLGCGDGRIVFEAARRGARAVGIDIDARFIAECEAQRAAGAGMDRATFQCADVMAADLSEATVVTCYLVRSSMTALKQKFNTLRSGARIISHAFLIEGWPPDRTVIVNGVSVYLWVTP